MDSPIDGPILCPDVHVEDFAPSQMNLSIIIPLSIRSQDVPEVWSQNLCGSGSNIDRMFEGENMRLSGAIPCNTFGVQNQNMYGSKSSIDRLHDEGNPRATTTFQNMIIEVRDQTLYGSECNLNCGEGRVSEASGMKRISTNARFRDKKMYGFRSSV